MSKKLTEEELLVILKKQFAFQHHEFSKWAKEQAYSQLKEIAEEHFGLKNWTCTFKEYYALPEPIRNYIAALETNADPPSMVRENIFFKEMIAALERKNELLIQTIEAQQKPTVSREWLEETVKGLFEYGLDAGWMRGHLTMRLKKIGVEVED